MKPEPKPQPKHVTQEKPSDEETFTTIDGCGRLKKVKRKKVAK